MTKLEKLYSIIENSREVGVKLSKEDGSLIRQFLQQHIGVKIEDQSFLDLHNLE